MKDYSAMSDFEINKHVAIIQGHKCYYDNGSYTNGHNKISVIVKGNGRIGQYDPCNRAEDAWPIIVENNISLHAPRFNEGWMAEFTGSDEDVNDGFDVDYFEYHNANPLRAAMIVYLQMMEAKS